MVSSAYRELTVDGRDITSLDVRLDPDAFTLHIPADFWNDTLPLLQYTIQPNPDFGKHDMSSVDKEETALTLKAF